MRLIDLIVIVLIMFALMAGADYGLKVLACHGRWPPPSESKYTIPGGCMVKVDNRWIPERAVRVGP